MWLLRVRINGDAIDFQIILFMKNFETYFLIITHSTLIRFTPNKYLNYSMVTRLVRLVWYDIMLLN